jgi:O-antigen ligase
VPPEFLKKIASNRIYSTLFYPNTLAGALLLFFPAMLLTTLKSADRWQLGNASRAETIAVLLSALVVGSLAFVMTRYAAGWIFVLVLSLALVFPVNRFVAAATLTLAMLAVLVWSGSKAGWLIMLLLAMIAFWRFPLNRALNPALNRRIGLAIVAILLIVGLGGFFVRYSSFFRKGATSVSARFDYWRAAVQITRSHPVLGTGPGTFQIPYEQIKRPEAEMTRLVHNDYLEQASGSGIPGFIFYAAFIILTLGFTLRANSLVAGTLVPTLVIWLGLFGWASQCLVEFSLQIPALAWPAFALMGYLTITTRKNSNDFGPGSDTNAHRKIA